ncbi:PAS domain-containing protein [Pontiellaceae bacterium B12219]|nr:PAS domain-containing protein [Pontiellaceae bacterium B12219]
MAEFSFQDAKTIIHAICNAAENNEFPTRKSFMDMLEANPHLAVQGYNAYAKIFYWNAASIGLYGYRLDEVVNKNLIELILPPEMRAFARDMISNGAKTGKMPEAGACDLLKSNGEYVTVYSGHIVFQWEHATSPEFYCIDLALQTESVV